MNENLILKSFRTEWKWLFIGLPLLVFLSRIPLLLSNYSAIDGDEAIVGLKAMHIIGGRSVPLFFYGQNYGLDIFEAGIVATYFKFFGISDIALRGATLTIWIVGFLFYVMFSKIVLGNRMAIIFSVLILSCPAWLLWSLKARGGYVTAWTFSGIGCCLAIVCGEGLLRNVVYGAVLAIIYFSHPIMLILPCLIFLIYNRKALTIKTINGIMFGAVIVLSVLFFSGAFSVSHWHPRLFGNYDIYAVLSLLPSLIFGVVSGIHWYYEYINLSAISKLISFFWIMLFVLTLLSLLHKKTWETGYTKVALTCVLSIFFTFTLVCFFNPQQVSPRYLLAVILPLIFLSSIHLYLIVFSKIRQYLTRVFVVFLYVIAIIYSVDISSNHPSYIFGSEKYATREEITLLVNYLESNGINNVYVNDPTLQWNIIFSSKDHINARWKHSKDRLPEYPMRVDRAYFAGEKTALIGWKCDLYMLDSLFENKLSIGSTDIISERFYVIESPQKTFLEKLDFTIEYHD